MTNFYKDKQQIIDWLDKYQVKNYTLIPNEKYGFVIDVSGDVDLRSRKLFNIPVKFNKIIKGFDCSNNNLISLEFCPKVTGGSFYCYDNQLTSLEFCPQTVSNNFNCGNNKLTSLEFCPQTVIGGFYCHSNQLTSLEFSPQKLGGDFYCNNNKLTSLKFSPKTVGDDFYCSNNELTSLNFCPQAVGGGFYCSYNSKLKEIQEITDFKSIYLEHKKILTTKFSDKLKNDLINDNSKKTAKIKI